MKHTPMHLIIMLNETSVYLVQDWAMKFLPRKYKESQTDWFEKQGIVWHITVAIHRAELDQKFLTMTCSQISELQSRLHRSFYREERGKSSHTQNLRTAIDITLDVITVGLLSQEPNWQRYWRVCLRHGFLRSTRW